MFEPGTTVIKREVWNGRAWLSLPVRVARHQEGAHGRRLAATEHRCFDVYTDQVGFEGTVQVAGTLDLSDALDLDAAIAAFADASHPIGEVVLGLHGTVSLDLREIGRPSPETTRRRDDETTRRRDPSGSRRPADVRGVQGSALVSQPWAPWERQ